MKKSTSRAESRPSRHLVLVCLFALVASAGCMRGCNCGGCGAPVSCKVDGDCPQRGKCSNGYCTWEADLGAQASACRAGSLCADEGRCGADYKMSFLGLSRETECVAVSDADCRAAKGCKAEGRCALQADHCEPREDSDCKASEACRDSGACSANDGRCEARSDEDCAPTKECRINDACHANAGHCVLDWSACRPSPGIVGPSWAMTGDAEDPVLATLKGGTKPDSFDHSLLVCHAVDPRDFDHVEVRLGQACPLSISVHGNHRSLWFTMPGSTAAKGDPLAVRFVDNTLVGADAPAFAKAFVGGETSLHGELDGASIDCSVFAPDRAKKLGASALAQADHAIVGMNGERPSDPVFPDRPPSHRDVERALSTAASFLGWDESGIVDRLRKVDDIDARWRTAESALFEKAFGTATAAGKTIALPSGLKVAVAGRVCGAELAARHREVDPDHDPPAVQCAVAMSIKNTGDQQRLLVVGSEPTLPTIAFVREGSGGIDYHSPTIAYARSVKGGLPRERVVELAPGDEASLLLVGDASFDATSVKDRVLMRVSDWGQTAYLRVDAP